VIKDPLHNTTRSQQQTTKTSTPKNDQPPRHAEAASMRYGWPFLAVDNLLLLVVRSSYRPSLRLVILVFFLIIIFIYIDERSAAAAGEPA
jgi:hypothetical protein